MLDERVRGRGGGGGHNGPSAASEGGSPCSPNAYDLGSRTGAPARETDIEEGGGYGGSTTTREQRPKAAHPPLQTLRLSGSWTGAPARQLAVGVLQGQWGGSGEWAKKDCGAGTGLPDGRALSIAPDSKCTGRPIMNTDLVGHGKGYGRPITEPSGNVNACTM